MKIHEKYINRCIQLAENGLGRTYPNPMVGSVIVHQDQVIGEGWHQKAGAPHAEVNAIASVQNKTQLKDATLYVSLEPCSHYGKTPPCTSLILDCGIQKVVIGTVDPYSEVSGMGIKKLLDAGCEVVVGVKEEACKFLNRRFFITHTKKRPYIILKWAATEDGYISPESNPGSTREPFWITNQYSRQLVHRWRAEEEAILVGTNTAVSDNPKLNIRRWSGQNPVRVVLDRHLRIPGESHLWDDRIRTIFLTQAESDNPNSPNLLLEKIDFEKNLPEQVCHILWQKEIQSVIIEGGRQTLQTFIDSGIWDEARVFTGPLQIGSGTKSPVFSGKLVSQQSLKKDVLKFYTND